MKKQGKMNNHIKVILVQTIFLVVVLFIIYLLYPRIDVDIKENLVNFNSINANVIIISENPDFSNPRYLEIGKGKNVSFNLKPGIYYWKADNGIIEGLKNKFTIESEVGMKIEKRISGESENETRLVNIGNVKINITKKEGGIIVGHIILEPNESEEIEDKGNYIGRQI